MYSLDVGLLAHQQVFHLLSAIKLHLNYTQPLPSLSPFES